MSIVTDNSLSLESKDVSSGLRLNLVVTGLA